MAQFANGLQRSWVGRNDLYVPPRKGQEGIEQDDTIVLSQLTRAQQEQQASLAAARTDLERLLGIEVTNRTEGDRQLLARLEEAIEGVSKRTVAARYDGTTPPTPVDVPGVDTAAPADDWHSWFLWDQGAGNTNTGFYYFNGNTPTRVTAVEMSAGLLTFVNSGNDQNTWWLMIDDPVSGVGDFIPWGRSTDLTAAGPLYITNNVARLAFEAGWLATHSNSDTGEIELTVAPEIKARLANLEVDVDDLQGRVTTIEGDQNTQNARLDQQDRVNAAQQTTIDSLGTRLTTNEQLDAAQTTRLNGLDAKTDLLRTDVDRANADNTTQNTLLDGLRRDVDGAITENTRQTQVEAQLRTDVDLANTTNTAQGVLLTGLRTDVDQNTADNVAQAAQITQLQTDVQLRQTAAQVLDAVNARLRVCNPIISLNESDPRVTRVVDYSVPHSDNRTYTRTTFTINLGEADFARTRLSESAAPYEEVSLPQGSYPGTTHVLAFLSAPSSGNDGSVPNGVIEAWFHKGFRATTVQPIL